MEQCQAFGVVWKEKNRFPKILLKFIYHSLWNRIYNADYRGKTRKTDHINQRISDREKLRNRIEDYFPNQVLPERTYVIVLRSVIV